MTSKMSSLISAMKPVMDKNEDFSFLKSMIMERRLHLLVKIHAGLMRFGRRKPLPASDDAVGLACNLAEELQTELFNATSSELISLLSNAHVKGLLSVHDTVARKGYEPELPPLPDDVEGEEAVRIVSLVKSPEPLGATIKSDESTGSIVVARIMKGGAADKSGLIHRGDLLKEVNGVPMENKKPEEILPILAQSQGEVTFTVVPVAATKDEVSDSEARLFVRTLFDYNPELDPAIPCRRAGLAFKRGDVLQIVSQEDDTWWQACCHGDRESRAGLIPSRVLQERRVALQRPEALFKSQRAQKKLTEEEEEVGKYTDYGAITGIHIAGLRRSFRLGRRRNGIVEMQQIGWRSEEMGGATQTPTYLEVAPYCRNPEEGYRMVLLVGPQGVGLTELKRRLVLSDPEHFGVTVPHTTRERRKQEKQGVEYNFVSRQMFEIDIVNHQFLEYEKHRGNYYGTSLNSVRKVIAEGKVCLLDVQPHALQRLHTAELKPYVVFVKPPPIQELRFSRRKAKFITTDEHLKPTKIFTEEDFEDMIASAEAMDCQYGHLFEKVLVNGDIVSTFKELRAELANLETKEPQWIPVEWIRTQSTTQS
ncbi:hypothetical protein UPYG_G00300990 [Umbra pygmaea]|uniref:MAGUK p55 subfamily member 7-like n=1 Tax=Umbra pygmaea TaxID=75934 RepID=A0ABD0W6F1_UMBPY